MSMIRIPKCGDLFTVEEWSTEEYQHMFSPDDGDGHWATATHTDYSSVFNTPRPKWATHVVWFNK
jgi:hypothetical protein